MANQTFPKAQFKIEPINNLGKPISLGAVPSFFMNFNYASLNYTHEVQKKSKNI